MVYTVLQNSFILFVWKYFIFVFILDLQGPPTVLDHNLCKMFHFWLSATCTKVYSTSLGFNNYELSSGYYLFVYIIFDLFLCKN